MYKGKVVLYLFLGLESRSDRLCREFTKWVEVSKGV